MELLTTLFFLFGYAMIVGLLYITTSKPDSLHDMLTLNGDDLEKPAAASTLFILPYVGWMFVGLMTPYFAEFLVLVIFFVFMNSGILGKRKLQYSIAAIIQIVFILFIMISHFHIGQPLIFNIL